MWKKLISGFLPLRTSYDVLLFLLTTRVLSKAHCVDSFCQKIIFKVGFSEHRSGSFNQRHIPFFSNPILLGCPWSREILWNFLNSVPLSLLIILILIVHCLHSFDEINNLIISVTFSFEEEHLGIPRVFIYNDKNIFLATKTYSIEKFSLGGSSPARGKELGLA